MKDGGCQGFTKNRKNLHPAFISSDEYTVVEGVGESPAEKHHEQVHRAAAVVLCVRISFVLFDCLAVVPFLSVFLRGAFKPFVL